MQTKYYCDDCGKELTDNFYCLNCERHSNRSKAIIESVLVKSDDNWQKRYANYIGTDNPYSTYFCHNCHYFMYHPTIWCAKCGNKLIFEKITAKQTAERYPNYKKGY